MLVKGDPDELGQYCLQMLSWHYEVIKTSVATWSLLLSVYVKSTYLKYKYIFTFMDIYLANNWSIHCPQKCVQSTTISYTETAFCWGWEFLLNKFILSYVYAYWWALLLLDKGLLLIVYKHYSNLTDFSFIASTKHFKYTIEKNISHKSGRILYVWFT